jgi:hypothetical protein
MLQEMNHTPTAPQTETHAKTAPQASAVDCSTVSRMPLSEMLYHLLTGTLTPVGS